MFENHKKESPIFTGSRFGLGKGADIVAPAGPIVFGGSGTWGVNSSSQFSSNGVYQFKDTTSDEIFYGYIKSINSKKALCVMASRQTGSGSEFYYSNSWWGNRVKVGDTETKADITSNTTANFLSEGFFRVPLQGAFVTSVTDSSNPNGFVEYTGTASDTNSLPNGSETSIPSGTLEYAADSTSSIVESGNWRELIKNADPDQSRSGYGAEERWGFSLRNGNAQGSNSISRAKFGFALGQEEYPGGSGTYYSANAYGFGIAADDTDLGTGSPGLEGSSGKNNARSNAGNSGGSETAYPFPLEFWIIPQNTWTYEYNAM